MKNKTSKNQETQPLQQGAVMGSKNGGEKILGTCKKCNGKNRQTTVFVKNGLCQICWEDSFIDILTKLTLRM